MPNALAADLHRQLDRPTPDDGVCDAFDCTLREAIDAANTTDGPDDINFEIGIGGSFTIFPDHAAAEHQRSRHDRRDDADRLRRRAADRTGRRCRGLRRVRPERPGRPVRDPGARDSSTSALRAFNSPASAPGAPSPATTSASTREAPSHKATAPASRSSRRQHRRRLVGRRSQRHLGQRLERRRDRRRLGQRRQRQLHRPRRVRQRCRPNGVGVAVGADSNAVGGTSSGDGNVISGNRNAGVKIANASNTDVLGNYIGTDADGTSAVGNVYGGVHIVGGTPSASSNTIRRTSSPGTATRVRIETTELNTAATTRFSRTSSAPTRAARNRSATRAPASTSQPTAASATTQSAAGAPTRNTIAYNSRGDRRWATTAARTRSSPTRSTTTRSSASTSSPTTASRRTTRTTTTSARTTSSTSRSSRPRRDARSATGASHGDRELRQLAERLLPARLLCEPGLRRQRLRRRRTVHRCDLGVERRLGVHFDTAASLDLRRRRDAFITATATDRGANTSEFSNCLAITAVPAGDTVLTVTTNADRRRRLWTRRARCPRRSTRRTRCRGRTRSRSTLAGLGLKISPTDADPLPPITDDVIIDGTTQPG